jgi:MSHA biogenesis protein MshM
MNPDRYSCCPTSSPNEALLLLTYGVGQKKAFVVVSGESTGKTLLVRCLLQALSLYNISFAIVYDPMLSVPDFLAHLLKDFGVPSHSHGKIALLFSLNNDLLVHSRLGGTTALVVDEAQLLSWEPLEEIRLLTNLETSQYKLLQIVILGRARARFDGTVTAQATGRQEMPPPATGTRRGARASQAGTLGGQCGRDLPR